MQPSKSSNRQKSRCNDCKGEKFPCIECSKTMYSSLQDQSSLQNQHILSSNSKQSKETSQNKKAPFVIPGRLMPTNDMLNKCSSCNEKDATRLCLNCNKIWCDSCALDHHEENEDHKILKLTKVLENIENEKLKLEKNISHLESLMVEKDGASRVLKTKEDEFMQKVDVLFEYYLSILENKKQAIKNEIKMSLLDVGTDYLKNTPTSLQGKNQGIEAFNWISSAKNLSTDIEKNKISDNNSLLCRLFQQAECFKRLDPSKLEDDVDTAAMEKSFDQIQIRHNNQLLEALKKETIVEIEIKEYAKKSCQTPSLIEESKDSSSEHEVSHNSKRKSQNSSPTQTTSNDNDVKNQAISEWDQKKLPKFAPAQKTDISKDLRKAFKSKLEIQVKTEKESGSILLESISKHNSNNPNVNNGLKNDAHAALFSEILKTKELKESCQKVSHLILDFFNLTEGGILHLSEAISQFPSLQTAQLSFYMTLGLYPVNLKPLFDKLAKFTPLKDLSLKLSTWTHLKGTTFLPFLSSISNISTLQSLSLDLSRCSRLDLQGISEAMKYLLRHKNIQKLQISFKGCINVYDDDEALENLYKNCLNSKFKGIRLDFSECPNLSNESLEVINDINKRKPLDENWSK